jgi:hypothetical protein
MIALALTLLLADLRFQGDWTCPERSMVQKQLVELDAAVHGRHVVVLDVSADSAELSLKDESGAELARRVLPADTHCERRAHVIAVLIAAWESEIASRPPELAPGTAPSAGSVSSTLSTTPMVALEPPPALPPSAPPLPPPQVSRAAQSEVVPESGAAPLEWRLALGPLVAVADRQVALGGLTFVALQPDSSRWEGQLKLFFTTPRTFTLSPGSISWQRFGGSLGGSFAVTRAPLVLQLQADAVLAILHTQAQGYTVNNAPTVVDPGASLGLLASWRGHTLEPWLGAWVYLWPFAQQAEVTGSPTSRTIPQLDLVVGLGVTLLLR